MCRRGGGVTGVSCTVGGGCPRNASRGECSSYPSRPFNHGGRERQLVHLRELFPGDAASRQCLLQAGFGHFHAEAHLQQAAHPGERDARAALVHVVEQEVDDRVGDRSLVVPVGALPAGFGASFSSNPLRDVVQASRRHASQRGEVLHLTSGHALIHRGRDRVVHGLVVRKTAARSLVDRARPREPKRGFRGHARTTRGAHPRAGSWRARARGLGVRTPSRRGRHLARRPRRPRGPIFGGVPRIRRRKREFAQTRVPRGKLTCQLISLMSNSCQTHVKLMSHSTQTHLKLISNSHVKWLMVSGKMS